MQLMLELDIPRLPKPITYEHRVLLTGSCFTENMSDRLAQLKFKTLSNPHGILFNPLSVASAIEGYLEGKQYSKDELFYLNELWNSWDHHTRFSHIHSEEALKGINRSQSQAAAFIREASHIIITLGSAFQYYLKENGQPVANNHRAPAQWFEKRLLEVTTIVEKLHEVMKKLQTVTPGAQVIFTISPVRHIRDGVVDNNRSKARLIESVHRLCEMHPNCYYFPSYELVIDILRDYRYYDIDFVHPNYAATSYIWEQFVKACIDPATAVLMKDVQEIVTARHHRPRFPETDAHRKFKASYIEKIKVLSQSHPYINWTEELGYFSEK